MGRNKTAQAIAADYVIHLDPWWPPAVVYHIIAQGTTEEDELHDTKRDLIAGVLEGCPSCSKTVNPKTHRDDQERTLTDPVLRIVANLLKPVHGGMWQIMGV